MSDSPSSAEIVPPPGIYDRLKEYPVILEVIIVERLLKVMNNAMFENAVFPLRLREARKLIEDLGILPIFKKRFYEEGDDGDAQPTG